MKNLTKIISSALLVGVLIATGINTFAATGTETNTTTSPSNIAISEKISDKGSMKKGKGGFGNRERPKLKNK